MLTFSKQQIYTVTFWITIKLVNVFSSDSEYIDDEHRSINGVHILEKYSSH